MNFGALSWRLADVPRTREFTARAKGGLSGGPLNGVGQIETLFDFAGDFSDYGAFVDYGGIDFSQASDFMLPLDPAGGWDGLDFGQATDIPQAEIPSWNWGSSDFESAPSPVSGSGGTVTSEGVGSTWKEGGGLSIPSMKDITDFAKVGAGIYGQITTAEANAERIARGLPPIGYGINQTMLPGVPRTTTGTPPMVWNPATNRYEPDPRYARNAAGQLIPGVSNTILIAGAAGIALLLMLGKKKG